MSFDPSRGKRAGLLISHPGHELRVHRWLELATPVTFVMTKGDGSHGVSRLDSSTRLLERAGAQIGSIYGRLDDCDLYRALLGRDLALFDALLTELVGQLLGLDLDYLVADSEEGYNPSHDVCRYLAGGATAAVSRLRSRPLADFDFPLVGPPDACPADRRLDALWIHLNDDDLARKLRAAHEYPELKAEVERAMQANGAAAFRVECLRPVRPDDRPPFTRPFYEEYGERQVASGVYAEVIRYDRHVRPIRDALRSRAAALGA
jgi:hypothetical protein